MTTPLQKAAQAVIDRWDAPSWKDQPHTAEYIEELRKALDAEIAESVEPDKFGKCIDDFGNSLVSVGDHVESSEAIFFVGAISDGGLCSIDTKKPFYAKSSGPMSKCVTQGNYAAKATALSFVYLQHPPQPQATTPVLRECWYESNELKVCRKCGQLHDKAIAAQGEKP